MKRQIITTYDEAVEYLLDIPRFTSKNTVEDTAGFLEKLGNPDKKMKIIHVAGTNGKGSVCAYLRAILEEAAFTTCVFTSPHLVDVRERFLVKGEMVSKEEFLEAFLSIYNQLDWETIETGDGYHPSFFEYLFFMAMLIFSKACADYCILETGLGGRLDATNSVSGKELAVITGISLEHTQYLGNTIPLIAGEKAGIIKEGAPLVFLDNNKEASDVILQMAQKKGVNAVSVSSRDYSFPEIKNKSIDFSLSTEYYGYIRLTLHTIAAYQVENASLAVRAIEVLFGGKTVTARHIKDGVAKCFWRGRMEEILPDIYVDGAHNDDGIRAFLETVKADACQVSRTLVFSAVSDKDYEHMIRRFAESGLFSRVIFVHIDNKRGLSNDTLLKTFEAYGTKGNDESVITYNVCDSVGTALNQILSDRNTYGRVYIAGSLYLVGEVIGILGFASQIKGEL